VPTALIAQEAEEESELIDLSKRDDQEKKQRKKRKGLYGPKHKGNQPAWSWKETTGQHHASCMHVGYRGPQVIISPTGPRPKNTKQSCNIGNFNVSYSTIKPCK
jgi:hypothetical protein